MHFSLLFNLLRSQQKGFLNIFFCVQWDNTAFFFLYHIVSTSTICLGLHCISLPEITVSTTPIPILSIVIYGKRITRNKSNHLQSQSILAHDGVIPDGLILEPITWLILSNYRVSSSLISLVLSGTVKTQLCEQFKLNREVDNVCREHSSSGTELSFPDF